MTISGLGQDGYVRIQKETTWGTAVTDSMTDLPCLPGSTFETFYENIENENVIASRVKQTPDQGRQYARFSLQMKLPYTLIGEILELFLGGASSSGPTDSTYTHTWLTPITGTSIGESFTLQVAKGGAKAEQLAGCVIKTFRLTTDNQGALVVAIEGVAKLYTPGVARVSSWSYPSGIPGNFSDVVLNLDNGVDSAFDQPCNSLEISIDTGLKVDNFKTGSIYTNEPIFETIPSIMLSCNVDADIQFKTAANANTQYAITVTATAKEYAAGTTYSSLAFEIPVGILNPETSIPFENDNLSMDLEFDCSYGGTTTGSGGAVVGAEVRVVDATATHT